MKISEIILGILIALCVMMFIKSFKSNIIIVKNYEYISRR